MDNREAVVAARELLTEQSEASGITLPRLHALIPTALQFFRTRCRKDPIARSVLTKTISFAFVGGVKDITAWVDGSTDSIDINDLKNSTLYDSSGIPLTWVASRAQILNDRQLRNDSTAVFLDGYTLRTKDAATGAVNTYVGTVSFQAIKMPLAVSEIPQQLEELFVLILAETAVGTVSSKSEEKKSK